MDVNDNILASIPVLKGSWQAKEILTPVNVLLIGGSGYWSEKNHHPTILGLKANHTVRVIAICDPNNPYNAKHHQNLQSLLAIDQPRWINTHSFTQTKLLAELNALHSEQAIDIVIIATDPVHHLFYVEWAIKQQICISCDKPLIVFKNAASELKSAQKIQEAYDKITADIHINQLVNPDYNLITPLRRRALTPCLQIAKGLQEVYELTKEGIHFMDIQVSGGIHRSLQEFHGGGAHGYLKGVGSLSHSAYHYIDLIAWYLQLAPGAAKHCEVRLRYVNRVKDYLSSNVYPNLQNVIGSKTNHPELQSLPSHVLNAELDFAFDIHLLDEHHQRIASNISFAFNHTTFTNRTLAFDSGVEDPANESEGGRMSQFQINIHQGGLQTFNLSKNDPVHKDYTIHYSRKCHPRIPFDDATHAFTDAHNDTITPKALLGHFIINRKIDESLAPYIATIDNQRFTHRLFSKFYELIAIDCEKNKKNRLVNPYVEIF